MRQLREFDLQLAFEAPRPLRKNIQNQSITVRDSTICEFFQIAFLARAQGLVDQHQIGVVLFGACPDFLGFARAHEILRIGTRPGCQNHRDPECARGGGQCLEFRRIVRIHRMPDADADRDGPFATPGAFKQRSERLPITRLSFIQSHGSLRNLAHSTMAGSVTSPSSPVGKPHIARRNDGGNGVLVDHLTHAVPQQYDELVERVDLTLQFDAVHEIN